jgi:hypothetical protein
LPTALPPPTRRVEKKRSLFTTVLNTFMVVSALLLTFMVLVREQGYANGQPGYFAGTFTNWTQQAAVDTTGERRFIPPSN